MLRIDTAAPFVNRITLTRGDSALLKLKLRDNQNKVYTLAPMDTATLTIKENIDSPDIILAITADKNAQFEFTPKNTANLACGKYVYDVQVNLADGSIYTVINPAQLIITKGVTE